MKKKQEPKFLIQEKFGREGAFNKRVTNIYESQVNEDDHVRRCLPLNRSAFRIAYKRGFMKAVSKKQGTKGVLNVR